MDQLKKKFDEYKSDREQKQNEEKARRDEEAAQLKRELVNALRGIQGACSEYEEKVAETERIGISAVGLTEETQAHLRKALAESLKSHLPAGRSDVLLNLIELVSAFGESQAETKDSGAEVKDRDSTAASNSGAQ
jgi:hypothetical protein